MRSTRAKVSHRLAGQSILEHTLRAVRRAAVPSSIVVVGHRAEDLLPLLPAGVTTCEQREQLGTGHAVLQARKATAEAQHLLILYGDVPLLRAETIRALIDGYIRSGSELALLTANVEEPRGYGRISRDAAGRLQAVVEEKSASETEQAIAALIEALRHGEAVAIGILFAALLAERLGRIGPDRVAEHRKVIGSFTGPDKPAQIAFKGYLILEIRFEDRRQFRARLRLRTSGQPSPSLSEVTGGNRKRASQPIQPVRGCGRPRPAELRHQASQDSRLRSLVRDDQEPLAIRQPARRLVRFS